MKKHIIIILIFTFFSNNYLISQNPENKVKTEEKDTIKPKKKKAMSVAQLRKAGKIQF